MSNLLPRTLARDFRAQAPSISPASAVSIGHFDGVHRGHQAMLEVVSRVAQERNLRPAVVTFEPDPADYFARLRGTARPIRLQRLRDRLSCIWAMGIEHIQLARFNAAMAALAPEEFCDRMLRRTLNARWLIVGEDFRFGAGRAGDVGFLRTWCEEHGIECQVMPTVQTQGVRFSSSLVREALAAGDCATAAALLGRPYRISGRVAQGDKLGRRLGFPTLNLPLWQPLPLSGVFAVRVHGIPVANGQALAGAASVGVRPTVTSSGQPRVEVHLLDFSGEIYGCRVVVEFVAKIRDEVRFSSLDAMIERMHEDVQEIRALLSMQKVS